MRADDVAVAVTQYVVMFVSSWSRVNDASGYGAPSDHAPNFSAIHAHTPRGESSRPYPSDWGLVPWISWYPAPVVRHSPIAPRARCSSAVRSSNFASAGLGTVTKLRWSPATCSGSRSTMHAHTIDPQSPPCTP